MINILETPRYTAWFERLRDQRARARIRLRIRRLSLGNHGDVKNLKGGVCELRIDYGPGYRVYFTQRDRDVVILLCGGDKRTQEADVVAAKALASDWRSDGNGA